MYTLKTQLLQNFLGKTNKQTCAPEILEFFFLFFRKKLKDFPPSFLPPYPPLFNDLVFLSGSTVCLGGGFSGVTPICPLYLHLIYISLNTLWYDYFPLQNIKIAAAEALGILLLSTAKPLHLLLILSSTQSQFHQLSKQLPKPALQFGFRLASTCFTSLSQFQ